MGAASIVIFFSHIRKLSIETAFNKQNDRVYARSSVKAREKVPCVQHRLHLARMMVWLGVNWRYGFTDVNFCEQGLKTFAPIYQQMLEEGVKPLNTKMFKGKSWIFQQDSAPADKVRTSQSGYSTKKVRSSVRVLRHTLGALVIH